MFYNTFPKFNLDLTLYTLMQGHSQGTRGRVLDCYHNTQFSSLRAIKLAV